MTGTYSRLVADWIHAPIDRCDRLLTFRGPDPMPDSPAPIPAGLGLTPPRDLTLTELSRYNAELRAELTTVTDVLATLLVLLVHGPIRPDAAKHMMGQLAAFREGPPT